MPKIKNILWDSKNDTIEFNKTKPKLGLNSILTLLDKWD